MNRGSLITSKLNSYSTRLLPNLTESRHANKRSPVALFAGVRSAERDMLAVKPHILIKDIREPGFALHGSYNYRLFGGCNCLRQPAALSLSRCQRPQKVRTFATQNPHCCPSALLC